MKKRVSYGIVVLALMLTSSCSSVHFRSKGKVPVTMQGNPEETKEVAFEIKRDFFFWGFNPSHYTIYLDEALQEENIPSLSKAIIYTKRDTEDVIVSIMTLGLYLPRTYVITGFTKEEN